MPILSITFYFLVLYCFSLELAALLSPNKAFDLSARSTAALEQKTSFFDMKSDVKVHMLNQFLYFVVSLLGVMSSQWPAFLAVLVISFVSKFYRHLKWAVWVDHWLCAGLLLTAVLNRFHLHKDIGGVVTTVIGV